MDHQTQSQTAQSTSPNKVRLLLPCPECRQETDSLKSYDFLDTLLFLFIFYSVGRARYTCCPGCMRMKLVERMAIQSLTANFIFPFTTLPWGLGLIIGTLTKGHSEYVMDAVRRSKRQAAQKSAAGQPNRGLPPQDPAGRRRR